MYKFEGSLAARVNCVLLQRRSWVFKFSARGHEQTLDSGAEPPIEAELPSMFVRTRRLVRPFVYCLRGPAGPVYLKPVYLPPPRAAAAAAPPLCRPKALGLHCSASEGRAMFKQGVLEGDETRSRWRWGNGAFTWTATDCRKKKKVRDRNAFDGQMGKRFFSVLTTWGQYYPVRRNTAPNSASVGEPLLKPWHSCSHRSHIYQKISVFSHLE